MIKYTPILLLFFNTVNVKCRHENCNSNESTNSSELSNHGVTHIPLSRAYLCYERINRDCGSVTWEPQSVEGKKGFPEQGPRDGRLASGGSMFLGLDDFGIGRWQFNDLFVHRMNDVYLVPIYWYLSAIHRTSSFRIYFSLDVADETVPITRSLFDLSHFCIDNYRNQVPNDPNYKALCPVPISFLNGKINKKMYLYLIWDISDTQNAFYQMADVVIRVSKLDNLNSFRLMDFIN